MDQGAFEVYKANAKSQLSEVKRAIRGFDVAIVNSKTLTLTPDQVCEIVPIMEEFHKIFENMELTRLAGLVKTSVNDSCENIP